MNRLIFYFFISIFLAANFCSAFDIYDYVQDQKKDFQIHLKQPAKEIKLLMYEKDFTPIQGKLSEDKKSIIIKNYQPGTKVHVKVQYEDGTTDEFTRSPCYIDPVVTS